MGTSPIPLQTPQAYPGKRRGPKVKQKPIPTELEARGVNTAWLAERLIWVADHGKPKERLEALDRIMALRGDIKDKNSGAAVTINAGPVMQIVGMSESRLKALRGALPSQTPEQEEEARTARANERLALLRRGELPALPSKSKADPEKDWNRHEQEVPIVESGSPERPPETQD